MSIVLDELTKYFGSQKIVDRVTLEVADGELFVLLGASGSGKSTILRLIAGLTPPDAGRIVLNRRDVTGLAPQARGVGFVFQNYSIFRHMTVAQNIEFGLKIRRAPASERIRRREELLDLVGLAGLGDRYAHQISGGQQQRVALARALAYGPAVLLLDEPFGALDVKIRAQLRRSLKQIQRQLGVTTILVTHDQEEAFELADRIGLIDRGQLLEVDKPEQLYARPTSLFGATFLGSGTVLTGRVAGSRATFGPLYFPLSAESGYADGDLVHLLFRPEQVAVSEEPPPADQPVLGQGTVVEQIFAGDRRRLRLRLPRLPRTRQAAPLLPFGEEGMLVDAVVPTDLALAQRTMWVALRGWRLLRADAPRLLVYDSERESRPVHPLASWLGTQLNATITRLVVAESTEAVEALRKRQGPAGERIHEAEIRVRVGEPAEQVAAEQAEMVYEFLLLSAGPRRQRLDPLVPELLERMGRQWLTPVLLVAGACRPISRVLICTAAGEPGKSDVRIGGRMAARLGAAVTLLHVMPPAQGVSPRAALHLEQAAATLRSLDVPTSIQTYAAETATQGILRVAQEANYDLVVIGGHGPQSRSIFGRDDVTLQVAAAMDRPLLVVPEDTL